MCILRYPLIKSRLFLDPFHQCHQAPIQHWSAKYYYLNCLFYSLIIFIVLIHNNLKILPIWASPWTLWSVLCICSVLQYTVQTPTISSYSLEMKEMSSWSSLTWHTGMKTAFQTKYLKSKYFQTFIMKFYNFKSDWRKCIFNPNLTRGGGGLGSPFYIFSWKITPVYLFKE